jgi:hypothetical protein
MRIPHSSTVLRSESGMANILIGPFILTVILFLAAAGFGAWAYSGMQDYKTNADQKIAVAVADAKKTEDTAKDAEFAQKEKYPLQSYTGPSTYGSVTLTYPKSWSAFVTEQPTGTAVVDGYFYPHIVPGFYSGTSYALRVQIVQQTYSNEIHKYDGPLRSGKAQATPYRFAKQPDILGTRIDGLLTPTQKGSVVMVPIRDKTLEIWTEADTYVNDFNTIILPSVAFTP